MIMAIIFMRVYRFILFMPVSIMHSSMVNIMRLIFLQMAKKSSFRKHYHSFRGA